MWDQSAFGNLQSGHKGTANGSFEVFIQLLPKLFDLIFKTLDIS